MDCKCYAPPAHANIKDRHVSIACIVYCEAQGKGGAKVTIL